MKTPIPHNIVRSVIEDINLPNFGKATIREIVTITNKIEKLTGERYIRMEMGVPGLEASAVGVKAEIAALQAGVASKYPSLDGQHNLKQEASRFIRAFIDTDIPAACCIPVVGSMQGTYASYLTALQSNSSKDTVLFIDPGFPVQKQQLVVMGYKIESFDAFEYRGERLIKKIESFLKNGNIAAISYSNPNNPSWICLQESELEGIGRLATEYDCIVVEDLAYFGMDFRRDLSQPFKAPFQVSVSQYTDNYIMLISSSKAFSYAGQRIGIAAISEELYYRYYGDLEARYTVGEFGNVFVNRVLYSLSAGTSHSAQYALAAMFKAASDGDFNFLGEVSEYARRAEKVKEVFLKHGFEIVYLDDLGQPIGDGFYFTIRYPGMTGAALMEELMYYGISSISLETTGSLQEGLRICTSFIQHDQYDDLEYRLACFAENHGN